MVETIKNKPAGIGHSNEADAAAGGNSKNISGKKEDQKKKKMLSKRQLRKQPNEKHKWPQHPKIQSMEARNKAYIRVAGLHASKEETIDPTLDLLSPEVKFGRLLGGTDQRKRHAAVSKLRAYLKARCDVSNENGGISEMDLLKLWKGLWYTLYMADKVPVQDELSKRLAELIWCVAGTEEEDEYAGQAYMEMCGGMEGAADEEGDEDEEEYDDDSEDDVRLEEIENTFGNTGEEQEDLGQEEKDMEEDGSMDEGEGADEGDEVSEEESDNPFSSNETSFEVIDDTEIRHCRGAHLASLFIRTFFRTLRREWGKMDKYRVDKFYTLVRLYMHEIFKYMAIRHWNLGIIRLFNDSIFEEVLNKTPNGLRYHLIDIAIEELAKVNATAPLPLTEATFLDALEPYFAMAQTGAGDDTVQARVVEKLLEKFLNEYSFVSDKNLNKSEDTDDTQSFIFDQVHVGTVAQFLFDLASDPETNDKYRKSLYEMHKSYMRKLKAAGKDVVLPTNEGEWHSEESQGACEEERNQHEAIGQKDPESKEVAKEEFVPKKSTEKHKRRVKDGLSENAADGSVTEKSVISKKRKNEESQATTPSAKNIPKKSKKGLKDKKLKARSLQVDDAASTKHGNKQNSKELEVTEIANKISHQNDKQASRNKKTQVDSQVEDEVITISLSEQKRARAGKKRESDSQKEVPRSSVKAIQALDSKGKRVKFDTMNRSKSFKASMKALVTTQPPKTSQTTPEKGILLNKGASGRSSSAKKARKKAVDYF